MFAGLSDKLFGKTASFRYLVIATVILLFSFLGGHDIWTHEERWADIVSGMLMRNDFLHPFIGDKQYYDKPLLSYWLIVAFTKILGSFSTWSLRLPSAFAGCLVIYSMFQLGKHLKSTQCGLVSAWLTLSCYFFVFWSRVSSADMLNLAGTLFALQWYVARRNDTSFSAYFVFFSALAITSLCKGLIAVVVALIAVTVDLMIQGHLRRHLNIRLLASLLLALMGYLLPFLASLIFSNERYEQNGLYMVYRENILRYFEPFDHRGPIYTYLIYLPLYLLPLTVWLFLPAIVSLPRRLHRFSKNSWWVLVTLLCLLMFFTLSGSRRSYYVIPIIPFAILFIADWLTDVKQKVLAVIAPLLVLALMVTFLSVDVGPYLFYRFFGMHAFVDDLQKKALETKPWEKWKIVLLDAETKIKFYLPADSTLPNYLTLEKKQQTLDKILQDWPSSIAADSIIISRNQNRRILQAYFPHHQIVTRTEKTFFAFLNGRRRKDMPIAFIPTSSS